MSHSSRLLTIVSPADCSLLPVAFSFEEKLSSPFLGQLTVVPLGNEAEFNTLLMQPIAMALHVDNQPTRYVHGIVSGSRMECDAQGALFLQLNLSPCFQWLDKAKKFAIFQAKSVLEIFRAVCKNAGLVDLLVDDQQLIGSYPKLDYCVQYDETDFVFLSRLLAQAGIYYVFEHTAEQHIMVLKDHSLLSNRAEATFLSDDQTHSLPHVSSIEEDFHCVSNQVSLQHYDPEQAETRLFATAPNGEFEQAMVREHYQTSRQSSSLSGIQLEALQESLRHQQQQHVITLESNLLAAQLDTHIEVVLEDAVGEVLGVFITGISHQVEDYSQSPEHQDQDIASRYHNTLQALPSTQRFMPALIPSPNIGGMQSAIVCGREGQTELDDHGRIQVRFLWKDQDNGAYQASQASDEAPPFRSCWLRVDQSMAQDQAGHVFLPRAGDEVKIDFINNDPNYPMIIGAMPRAKNFQDNLNALPEKRYVTGLYSASDTLDTSAQYLELDDTPGAEAIRLHAKKDFIHTVADKASITVQNNYQKTTHGDTVITAGSMTFSAATQFRLQAATSEILITPEAVTITTPHLQAGPASENPPAAPAAAPAPKKETKPDIKLIIYLCDRHSEKQPKAALPALVTLFDQLSAKVTWQYSRLSQEREAQSKNAKIVIDYFEPASTEINIDLHAQGHLGYAQQSLYILSKNGQALAAPAIDGITIKSEDWKKTPPVQEADGHLHYEVTLTLLEPLMLYNFRQDAWGEGADPSTSTAMPYFNTAPKTGMIENFLPQWVLDNAKQQGNNLTFFIHGYNVAPGELGHHYQVLNTAPLSYPPYMTVPGIVSSEPDGKKNMLFVPHNHQTPASQNGTGAYNWLLSMEYHLNQAAGFDGHDFSQYTRLIGICWQGNPALPTDYMAAVPMATFAAQKLFGLIQQCDAAGIKINLVAHSLGNAVLMHALNLCGQNGIQVEHSFLWNAAIPDHSFAQQSPPYFPMIANQLRLGYEYHYPQAAQGSKAVTVLYSDMDNILGELPLPQKYRSSEESPNLGLFVERFLHDAIIMSGALIYHGESDDRSEDHYLDLFVHKEKDPGAGFLFAMASLVVYVADPIVSSYLQGKPLRSIYHVANLFVDPLSYLLDPTHHQDYYQRWRQQYTAFNVGETTYPFAPSMMAQYQQLRQLFPSMFTHLDHFMREMDALKAAGPDSPEFEQLLENITQELNQGLDGKPLAKFLFSLAQAIKQSLASRGTNPLSSNPALAMALNNKLNHQLFEALSCSVLTHWQAFTTLILSVLLTDGAQPSAAMGFHGAKGKEAYNMENTLNTLFQTAQKDPSGKDLCVDHCAMHFPSEAMMKWVFKNYLMEDGQDWAFKHFGKWKG